MGKNRVSLNQSCKDLLEYTAGDLIPELESSPKSVQVQMLAFRHYLHKTKETVEVQIIVTRNESDFMDPLNIEHTERFNS